MSDNRINAGENPTEFSGSAVDRLTGLLSKAGGIPTLIQACKLKEGSLAIIDLDAFKLVNDKFGHESGDKMLKAFADALRENLSPDDIMSRIGGDEFIVFITDKRDERVISDLVSGINDTLSEKATEILGENFGIPVGISAGAVYVPDYGTEFEKLFVLADHALYNVKRNGRHGYGIYVTQTEETMEAVSEKELEEELLKMTSSVEEKNDIAGGLFLGQESFALIYRFFIRFYQRYGGTATKMLFVLTDRHKDKKSRLREASAEFSIIAQESLRRSDIIMQCKSNEFFLFMPELSEYDAKMVAQRILSYWQETDYAAETNVIYTMDKV